MSKNTVRKEVYAEEPAYQSKPGAPSAADEFERFFAEQFKTVPASAPQAASPAVAQGARQEPRFDDPMMAELARIVGHGAAARAVAPVQEAASQPRQAVDPLAAFEEELRRFDELHRSGAAPLNAAPDVPSFADANNSVAHDPLKSLEDELKRFDTAPAELRGAVHDPAANVFEGDAAPPPVVEERPRSRKVVWMLGGAAAFALVGVVGAVTMNGGKRTATGEPPVIAAKSLPMKEKPADPGGVEIPGQDRQVLARGSAEPPKAANVVNKEEQPVDLNQTPKREVARVVLPPPNGAAPAVAAAPAVIMPPPAAAQPAAPAPAATPSAGGFEAKRVRSVKVGPEGDAVAPAPAAPVAPTIASIAAQPPAAVTAPVAPKPAPAAKVEATTTAAVTPKSEARPATATRAQTTTPQPQRQAARPAPAAEATDTDEAAENRPLSLRPPAGASATRAVAKTTTPTTTASTGGGFAVQLAAAGSEAEARNAASSLKKKYSALSGYNPSWRSSDVNGRTVYRVRVGGLSREKANELCSKLKAGGGSCFVASN